MKIGFVIISFNADIGLLSDVLRSIEFQADKIVLVDNGSSNAHELNALLAFHTLHLIKLGQNLGIAAASNIGARYLRDLAFDRVVFCDQDTIFPKDYRDQIINAISLTSKGNIVPQFNDVNKNELSVFQAPNSPLKSFVVSEELTIVLHGIASGLCVDLNSFFSVGGFDDDLFIDWVDFEFCWRAASHGVATYCVKGLIVDHRLGDENIVFFGRNVCSRSPIRLFFMVRNEVYLGLFGRYTPFSLRPFMIFRALRRALVMPFIVRSNRREYFRMAFKGLTHGLGGKLGPLS